MTSPTPSLEACDAELARLTSANDAIANTLVELDADSTRKLLATGPLRGVTAQRWQSAEAHIDEPDGCPATTSPVTQPPCSGTRSSSHRRAFRSPNAPCSARRS